MVIIITGATHTGKTLLAQKLLEKCKYPCLSIDHLKMGLIRNKITTLTPEDDELLVPYLWGIIKEIIKTAIENKQNLIIEGCYIPYNFRKDFNQEYLKNIKLIVLAMTNDYIDKNYQDIINHESDIEERLIKNDFNIEKLKKDNEKIINGFRNENEEVVLINDNYMDVINKIGGAQISDSL